jgi:hypothetical protein
MFNRFLKVIGNDEPSSTNPLDEPVPDHIQDAWSYRQQQKGCRLRDPRQDAKRGKSGFLQSLLSHWRTPAPELNRPRALLDQMLSGQKHQQLSNTLRNPSLVKRSTSTKRTNRASLGSANH